MWRIGRERCWVWGSLVWPGAHSAACLEDATKVAPFLARGSHVLWGVLEEKEGWRGKRQRALLPEEGQKRLFMRHSAKMRKRGRTASMKSKLRLDGKSPEELAAEDEEEFFQPQTPYKNVTNDVLKASFEEFPALQHQRLLQVGLLGVPNAGKSELTNQLVGNKVSATSSKENTTVATGVGVFVVGNTQVVMYDLPGVIHPDDAKFVGQLARVKGAWATAACCDYILFLVDTHLHLKLLGRNQENKRLEKIFAKLKIGLDENGQPKDYPPVILILNKVDLVPERHKVEELAKVFYKEYPFKKCFLVSALRGGGIQYLKEYLVRKAITKEWTFPPGVITDKDPIHLALELVREKLYRRINKEVPYQIQPVHEAWTEMPDGTAVIKQTIYVKSDSVRRMVIGRKGEVIQSYIAFRARRDLMKILGRKINLSIKVKVENPLGKLAHQGK